MNEHGFFLKINNCSKLLKFRPAISVSISNSSKTKLLVLSYDRKEHTTFIY